MRITISAFLLRDLLARGVGNTSSDHALLAMVAAGTGVLLGIGLWTPVAGVLSAGVELSIALSRPGEFWICLLASGIASSLTLLGPGAWSLDAIAYGRKRISISGQ